MSLFWTKNAVKEVVRRHWSGRAETFDQGITHAPQSAKQLGAWQARMKAWAGDSPIDVLDMGCGTGFLALELAALGHHVKGADFSEQMIERARAKAQGSRQGPAGGKGHGCGATVDHGRCEAVSRATVENARLRPQQRMKALSEVLEESGRLVVGGQLLQKRVDAALERIALREE